MVAKTTPTERERRMFYLEITDMPVIYAQWLVFLLENSDPAFWPEA